MIFPLFFLCALCVLRGEIFMQMGLVVGHAVSTVKHPSLHGWKLLLVQLLGTEDKPDGEPILAIDRLGAGSGDRVLVCNDGAEARAMVGAKDSPARWFVMGLAD
ncbi:MAG: EutN/CcmL family microcompartment protein [Gemmataceae bacterium]